MGKAVKKKQSKKRLPRLLGVLLVLLGLALAAALALGAVLVIAPMTERVDESVVPGSADWMARLDDEKRLNELLLPGTNESASRYTPRAFFTKRQALSVREQLEAGYRFLDLRVTLNERGDGFTLVCAEGDCRTSPFGGALTLDEILGDCYAFLDAHPRETLLLAVRTGRGAVSDRRCGLLFDAYIRERPDYWLAADTIPTLGEARGKLLLLRSWDDAAGLREEAGLPLRWRDQGGFDDTSLSSATEDLLAYTLHVQDRREFDPDDKWAAFLAGMSGAEEGSVTLSFLSTKGSTRYGHPYEFAKDLNARLMSCDDAALHGWIAVDFGSAALAERLYRLNF